MQRHTSKCSVRQRPGLYRLVFDVVYTRYIISCLFLFFLLHPVAPVFAAEPGAEDSAAEATSVAAVESEETTPAPAESEVEISEVGTSELPVSEDVSVDSEAEEEQPTDIGEPESVLTTDTVENAEEVSESDHAVGHGAVSDVSSTTEVSITEPIVTADDTVAGSARGTTTESDEVTSVASTTPSVSATSTTSAATTTTSTPTATTSTPSATSSSPTEVMPDVSDEVASPEPVSSPDEPSDPETSANTHADESAVAATTTEPEIVYVTLETTNDLNRHSFSVDECVSVGDGSFYCSKMSASSITQPNGVFSRQDTAGDHEIYFSDNGSLIQLTDNAYEDKAPVYDIAANEVVWHRLVDGRYQIMRYNLTDQVETQLTSGHTNHMEPAQADGVTVWQQWESGNWEIYGLIDDEIRRLSQNEYHDVAPTVRDGYVMWHTTGVAGEKLLTVYEIDSASVSTIADPDGGQVSNPRFVLVYDTTSENGDVITKTYDPETGAVTPVGAEPAPLPALPDPEPTGEATAIIQNKSASGREFIENDFDDDLVPGVDTNQGTSTDDVSAVTVTTSTSSASSSNVLALELDLRATSSEPLLLTDYDLIIEPYEATSSAQTAVSATSSDSVE